MMVGSSSAGRCVTSPRYTPYLLPSLAMRDTALRVGPKPSRYGRRVAVRLLADHQQRKRLSPHTPNSKAMRSNTEATASTTSAGKPASCTMVIGRHSAGGGTASTGPTIVSPPVRVIEHEPVARSLRADWMRVIRRELACLAVLQLAERSSISRRSRPCDRVQANRW